MKQKTSVTLSTDVLAKIDRLAGSKNSRSSFIESVLRKFLRDRARAALHARDFVRINGGAERLNAEASDVLAYQSSEE